MSLAGDLPRYCPQRALPPYSYVPGCGLPHPISDPRGHSFGLHEPLPMPLDELTWRQNGTWLFAIDLFNCGYYWEAHEAWEALWHACGRKGATADLLKGLIKLAAAGVKSREGRPKGVTQHAVRACELLESAKGLGAIVFGLSIAAVEAAVRPIATGADFVPPRLKLAGDD